MSQQSTTPRTPKQTYAAALQATPAATLQATPTPAVMQTAGVCTRGMTKKIVVNTAAARLRAAVVPTKVRTYSAVSIAAAANAVIASASPQHKEKKKVQEINTPLYQAKIISPKKSEVPQPDVASVMTIESQTVEDQIEKLVRLVDRVTIESEEKNRQIVELQRQVMALKGKEKYEENEISEQVIVEGDTSAEKIILDEPVKAEGIAYSEKELQMLIANAVKTQLAGSSSTGMRYTKPYTKRVDNLRMPLGYQPPKFQQFDGKGNPKQHVAHFVETCNNAGTEGDLLVKQFVRSLRGIAFDWYTDLEAESIDSWDHMEDEFLNRFYSTRRIVSMSELTNTKQWENEPVIDYIERWRALSLECKDRISETSAVEMCIDGMCWELLYILKGIKPRNFQELATRAHDMEITVKGHGKSRASSSKTTFEKKENTKTDKVPKTSSKEVMVTTPKDAPVKISAQPKYDKNKDTHSKDFNRERPTLKELQAKKYPFPDSDLSGMLDSLLEQQVIQLPEPKRPDEVNKINDPKYCRYHRLVSHRIEDCISLKELIMKLAREGKILLDLDEKAEVNYTTTTACYCITPVPSTCISLHRPSEWCERRIQFGSLEPVAVLVKIPLLAQVQSIHTSYTTTENTSSSEDDDVWTVVTRRKPRKQVKLQQQPQPALPKRKQGGKKKPSNLKKKKKSKKIVKSYIQPIDLLKQDPLMPITLKEFFPEGYFDKVSVNTTSTSIIKDTGSIKVLENDVTTDELLLRQTSQKDVEVKTITGAENATKRVTCNTALTFSDEDLLLGSKSHNRPLYISGYIREQKINRIMVDGGSGVNLMPRATMNELGITSDELSTSRTIIHGFNLTGEHAIGTIRVTLNMSDLTSNTLFHVIEAKTSFKLLLGRPWMHENGVVASTLHQCIKYYRSGERKINGDVKPFTDVDAFFADAKFFEECDVKSNVVQPAISSVEKKSKMKEKITKLDEYEIKNQSNLMTNRKKQEETIVCTPVLRYVPKSRRKEGDSPFVQCQSDNRNSSMNNKINKVVNQEWVEKIVTPLPSTRHTKICEPPLTEYPSSSTKPIKGNTHPFDKKNKGKFGANAYKLLEKAGYDFENPSPLGSVLQLHPYGLNEMQKTFFNQGSGFIANKHVGLGYVPTTPVTIFARSKGDSKSSLYITTTEIEENEDEVNLSTITSSVFDRIRPPATRLHPSVFDRIGTPVKQRLPYSKNRVSVFKRLHRTNKTTDAESSTTLQISKHSVFKRLGVTYLEKKEHVKKEKSICNSQSKTIMEDAEVTTSYHITFEEFPDATDEVETNQAPETLEDGGQSTIDDLKELNLGTVEDPRPIFVSALLTEKEKNEYYELLTEYKDVFAWNYTEMPGLNPKFAVHRLAVKKGVTPKKQPQRRFRPELIPEIEKEVNKLIDADFIREVKYPTWIANIVPVRKKNGQLRVCVDFRDLNNACPKDDFPLPVTELMIDATTGHEALSFLDCTAGYNQIYMAPEDQEATGFRTPKGIFCYKVMPFGLKNAGATYQRAMQKIFEDMIHKTVECYVDDVVVKSKKRKDHTSDLRLLFERLRKCQLKMNPLKCAFGVTSGKFLGFVVTHRGIEVDQTKIKAIEQMPEPRSLKELRGLQGRLAYIRRFISNLAGRCQPFSHLMKKDAPFVWDDKCRKAFDNIKKYLSSAPVLGAPVPGKPLIMYIAAQEHSLGAMCAQETNERKERPLYYLSRTLVGAELNYSPIEKICLALVFAVQKLKHYMQAYTVHVVSKTDPIKYILSRPILSGRLAKWAVLLKQYDLIFVPQKAVKGQAIADFFADHPVPVEWELSDDLPGEDIFYIDVLPPWKMYFDGAARRTGAGAGVVFVSPESHILPYSFTLSHLCSNNAAEYQALLIGLQMALQLGIRQMDIYGDSQLVVNQIANDYEVRKDDLIHFHRHATQLLNMFDLSNIGHVPRGDNKLADALANLAANLALGVDDTMSIPVCNRWIVTPLEEDDKNTQLSNLVHACETEEDDWRQPIIDFLEHQILPADSKYKVEIRRRASKFIFFKGTLYRRSFLGQWLRCLNKEEAAEAVREAHAGICGAHQSGPKLHDRVKRMGYYWPTMVKDCMEFAKRCDACQFNANFIHQPPEPLHPTIASWPFEAWGLDVVGPITPKASNGHMYILAATDYFSKWAEAITLREVKKENVADFIRTQIIYRYGVPHRIITDNGKPFSNKLVTSLCEKFKFKQYKSSMYNAPANGLAEAFNKTLCNLLKKVVSKSKRDWHEKIGEALWAYRTTYKTPTQATPYALVYGVEAVIPLELEIPSMRIAIQEGLTTDENDKLRLAELEALDEQRLQAQQNLQCYQSRLSRAFNKKVRPRSFQKGDLVLAVRRPIIVSHKTGSKFTSKWDGPYVVQEVYTNGAYKIVDQDGLRIGPINGKFLKRYYP